MDASRTVRYAIVVAALAAAGVFVWLATEFRSELATQRARVEHGSRIVATRCDEIEIAEAGGGEVAKANDAEIHAHRQRPTLLVVHGSGGGFDQGLAIGADYAARGWRVIAPSRFGYLRTPWPDTPSDNVGAAQADHLACLLDALAVAKVTILGVSAGAIAATEFAVRHPQRTQALVLMVPAGYRPDSTPPFPGWAQRVLEATISADLPFWLATRLAPDAVRHLVLGTPPAEYAAASPTERERTDRLLREILPISARRRGLLHDTLATQNVPRPRFEDIRAPTLAISARDDGFGTYASAEYAAQHILGARFLGFERGGHLLLGRQAEVVAAVEALR